MQKILYLLLLISVASFGQSKKEKPNTNNYSIYNAACFTLNDSFSAFKLFEFDDSTSSKNFEYRIKGFDYSNKIKYLLVLVLQQEMSELDSNNIQIFAKKMINNLIEVDKNARFKKLDTTIGHNCRAYNLDVTFKIEAKDMLENLYILKHNNKSIILGITMNKTKDSPYYLQEFNKLVNTIKLK